MFSVFAIAQNFKRCNYDTIHYFAYVSGTSIKEITGREIAKYANNKNTELVQQKYNTSNSTYTNQDKVLFTYDANGNKTESLFLTWDTDLNIWENKTLETTKYNASSLITENRSFNWISSSNSWQSDVREKYYYNANNQVSSYTYEEWKDDENALIFRSKKEYEYLSSTNLLYQTTYFSYNSSSATWNNSSKEIFSYNFDNQIQTKIYYNWNTMSSSWKTLRQIIYSYDLNKKLSVEEEQNYVVDAFENDYKILYKYDANIGNKLISTKQLNWNRTISKWDSIRKTENYYNTIGKLGSINRYDMVGSNWKLFSKSIYVYDSRQSLIRNTISFWNESENKLINQYDYFYEYNSDTFLISKESHEDWDLDLDFYTRKYGETYSCPSIKNTDINNLKFLNIKIYPNPTTNQLIIESLQNEKYEIRNYVGSIIQLGVIKFGQNTINLSSMPNGIYFVKINNQTQKIIIN